MRWGFVAVTVAAGVLAFQNCSSDLGPGSSDAQSTAQQAPPSLPILTPSPTPDPTPNWPVQPNSMNALADVKPYGGGCPLGYGVFDLLTASPAISGQGWPSSVCAMSFNGGATVLADAMLVTGSQCPAGADLVVNIPGGNGALATPQWFLVYSICTKKEAVPAKASFVTYFYLSSPNANCRTGDVEGGSGMFCTQGMAGGTCQGGVTVKFCKSVQ